MSAAEKRVLIAPFQINSLPQFTLVHIFSGRRAQPIKVTPIPRTHPPSGDHNPNPRPKNFVGHGTTPTHPRSTKNRAKNRPPLRPRQSSRVATDHPFSMLRELP